MNTRRNMNGGANNDACVAALRSVLPGPDDWERMVESDSSAVDEQLSYQEWRQYQINTANKVSKSDCKWLTGLCERVEKSKIRCMDMESCEAIRAVMVFFDKSGRLVIANAR